MDVLIEVYDGEEFDCVIDFKLLMIGINNWNFKIFEVILDIICDLVKCVLIDCMLVVESGLFEFVDLVDLVGYGVWLFLIGESLMC